MENIKKVTYTASLVSDPREVDAVLDPLREITSRTGSTGKLSKEDISRINKIQEQLEIYLTTKERFRNFTPSSLQLQIDQYMSGGTKRASRLQLQIVIAIAFSAACLAATLLDLNTIQQRIQVGGATAFSLLTVGAASLFLTALPAFKSELRRTFLLICAAVTLLGISLLGQPLMEIFALRSYPLTSIVYSIPIFIAALLFHVGDVRYARQVGVKSFWMTTTPILIIGIVLSVITVFIPHRPTNEPEFIHDFVAVIWAWMLLMPIGSIIVLPMAIRRLPELYKQPIRFLFYAMIPIVAVVLYQYVLRVTAGPFMEGPIAYVLFSLVIIMGLMLLRAGYTFHKVSRY